MKKTGAPPDVRHLEHIAVGFNLHAHHGPLQEALRLAREAEAHLDVLYVLGPKEDPSGLAEKVEQIVRTRCDDDCPSLTVHILRGKVPEALGRFCSQGNTDLLVVGPRATTLRERFLTGGPAAKLARFLDVPVLVASQESRRRYTRVLVPVDFSAPAAGALITAIEWLEGVEGAEIHLLHVFGKVGSTFRMDQGAQIGRLLAISTEEMHHYVDGVDFQGIPHQVRVVVGVPSDEILRDAEEIDADLIVVGTVGRNWLGEAIIGSTTARLIKKLRRPTLVVHPMGRTV